ncbi:MAG: response regulator [Candidatus Omnitrophica bacterium]|nr:response regulator [Candidatus Omnitrophota bacterium]
MEQFFSTFEVAEMCHVSPGSVIRWIHEGKLKAAVTAGGHHRIQDIDLVQFLTSLRMPIPEGLSLLVSQQNLPLKVLIVDDEESIRRMLYWFFQQNFPEAKVDDAPDAFIAGWKAHGLKPDIVITDIVLPGVDGFRLIQILKSFPELGHTRIIAMTGFSKEGTRDNILRLGANDFLEKPFEPKVLKQKVTEQIQILNKAA